MKKRYLVFGYDAYYPMGGWNDFIGVYETLEEAKENTKNTNDNKCDFYDIVDIETMKIVDKTDTSHTF